MTTALLQATFEDHMSLYPSSVRPLPPRAQIVKPQRNHALEERVAEIKAEIIAEIPYLWNKRARHHHEDIIEHISYEQAFTARTAKLIRAACRSEVSDAALGIYFRALIEDAIRHQAKVDLEKIADEVDESDSDEWYRSL